MSEELNRIISAALASLSREEDNTQGSGEDERLTNSTPELQHLRDHLDHNSEDKSKFEVCI